MLTRPVFILIPLLLRLVVLADGTSFDDNIVAGQNTDT